MRSSQDRDEIKKFYGYGDHKVSGIEIRPKAWTGGEVKLFNFIFLGFCLYNFRIDVKKSIR